MAVCGLDLISCFLAGTLMEVGKDRRKHRRLPLKLTVLCRKVGSAEDSVYTGKTLDVSPGGMLMEINSCGLNQGQLLTVEMSVPPAQGLLEYGGRFSSHARVVRVENTHSGNQSRSDGPSVIQTIAMQFCELPKLNV